MVFFFISIRLLVFVLGVFMFTIDYRAEKLNAAITLKENEIYLCGTATRVSGA